ncbi:MAG: hypothetical protein HYU73_29390 [Betaproteobacteria bacterium]|nr:hypothetical protein [Betaproteobacteria bacterium]MBI3055584.1 hypothetical protein [Betaproteobacteria bacterium]
MAEIVVADAGPIIALARIEQLELLSRVFSRAILPLSVYRETQRRPELSDAQSHCGVFMDEKAGRAAARVLGLKTIGTLGVLSLARSKGFVTELKPLITNRVAGLDLDPRFGKPVETRPRAPGSHFVQQPHALQPGDR